MSKASLELDLDVDTRGEVETHQRIDGTAGGIENVDKALVGAHLELLARVLVLVRGADDRVEARWVGGWGRTRGRRSSAPCRR